MSQQEQPAADGSQPIRFDQAEYAAGEAATRCAVCGEPLAGSYFEINGVMVCPRCRARVETAGSRGTPAQRALPAVGAGLGAAIAGARVYYATLATAGFE